MVFLIFILLDFSLHACVYLFSWHDFRYILFWFGFINIRVLICATWLHFTYSLDRFLTTPGYACPDPGVWNVVDLPWSFFAQWKRDGNHLYLFSFSPSWSAPRFSFAACGLLPVLVHYKSLCESYFYSSWWCNILLILDHILW